MTRDLTSEWDTLENSYTDQFGLIAPDVYAAAGRIWRQARIYAGRVLSDNDPARARTLLLKAAAQVTRARDERHAQVDEIEGYLFQTFKRIVLAELEKDSNRRHFESQVRINAELRGQVDNVERRILLDEIVAAMDEWTRRVFEWLTLDYTFDEIARHLKMDPRVVRNRYRRHLMRLIKSVNPRRE